jgi:hypothetical protein
MGWAAPIGSFRSRLGAVIALAVPVALVGNVIPAAARGDTATTTTQVVLGTVRLSSVACRTANTCEAVGYSTITGNAEGVVVPITNGTPGTARVVPGTALLFGVACRSATTCEAVGVNSSV